MEVKLNFLDCLVCDVKFCAVTLAPQSQDERLLDIFCHYLELSPKDVEKVYDERLGFPFCDSCRDKVLCGLSRLHENLTAIHNEINQLVTNVCKSIINISSDKNKTASKPSDSDDGQGKENDENYSREAIDDIRKSITNRFNPTVSLIQLDFQRLHRQSKNLEKKKKQQQQIHHKIRISSSSHIQSPKALISQNRKNEDLKNDHVELNSYVNTPSTCDMEEDPLLIKGEPSSPSTFFIENEQEGAPNSPFSSVRVNPHSRKRKQIMTAIPDSNFNLDFDSEFNFEEEEAKEKAQPVPKKRGRGRPRKIPLPPPPPTVPDPEINVEAPAEQQKVAKKQKSSSLPRVSVNRHSKKIKSIKRAKYEIRIMTAEDVNEAGTSTSKSGEHRVKEVLKKREQKSLEDSPPASDDPDFNAEDDVAEQNTSSDEEYEEKDLNDFLKGISPKERVLRKGQWGTGDPKVRERCRKNILRNRTDPWIEVEPNVFRRKESGWGFRKQEIDGIEQLICLAEGCPAMFDRRRGMIVHISMCHIHDKKISCAGCKRIFETKEHLDKHECVPTKRTQDFGNGQYVYDGIWPFHQVDMVENGGCDLKCGTCGSLHREQSRMRHHIRRFHIEPTLTKFPCEICGKLMANKQSLQKHVASHSAAKDVVCEQCGLCFKSRISLRAHVQVIHERGPKSYKCDFPNCDKAFSRRDALKRHRRTEGHPKAADAPRFLIDPITCAQCERKFVKELTYNKHLGWCQGKVEHICSICGKKSVNAQALRRHIALVHKEEYALMYPEGQYKGDHKIPAERRLVVGRRNYADKKRAVKLQKRMAELKQLKQNEAATSSIQN